MNAEAELIALRSMCRAAADEIMEHWDAHCDADGYGPCNLHARLAGRLRPDLYPGHASAEEIARFNEIMHNAAMTSAEGVPSNGGVGRRNDCVTCPRLNCNEVYHADGSCRQNA